MDPYGNINPPYLYGYESEGSTSFDVPNYNLYAPSDVPNYKPYAPPAPQGAYANLVPPRIILPMDIIMRGMQFSTK